jgi:hypothetical protein
LLTAEDRARKVEAEASAFRAEVEPKSSGGRQAEPHFVASAQAAEQAARLAKDGEDSRQRLAALGAELEAKNALLAKAEVCKARPRRPCRE